MNIDWKTLFTSPAGRIKRQTYWIAWIVQFVASLAASLILGGLSVYVSAAIGALLLYPLYCVYAKRLQDMGRPGVIAAVPVAVGLISLGLSVYMVEVLGVKRGFNPGAAQNMAPELMGTMMTVGFVSLGLGLISLAFWLVLGIANGQEGPNRFGPEPGEENEEIFD